MTVYLIITTCINSKPQYQITHASSRYIQNKIQHQINQSNDPERRSQMYDKSIRQILSVLPSDIKPIIVENNGKRPTFLDKYGIPVHYTENNRISEWHKGVNELADIHSVINAFDIQPDDMIIKITGRYYPIDGVFFRYITEVQDQYEAFVKFFNVCTLKFDPLDCVLGLFAIRCKHLKEFQYQAKAVSPEVQFAQFVRNIDLGNETQQKEDTQQNKETPQKSPICEIKQLYLECCFADDLRVLRV